MTPQDLFKKLLEENNLKVDSAELSDFVIRRLDNGAMLIEVPVVKQVNVSWADPTKVEPEKQE